VLKLTQAARFDPERLPFNSVRRGCQRVDRAHLLDAKDFAVNCHGLRGEARDVRIQVVFFSSAPSLNVAFMARRE